MLILLGALIALLVVAYAPAVPAFFVSDDLDMLSGDASDLFSPASGFGRFMPLAAVVHRVAALGGDLDPVSAHAFLLMLHVTCTLLVFALGRALGLRAPTALLAALLFGLYPRHHQVVMWFGAVSLALACTLGLATIWFTLRAVRGAATWYGWAAVGCYLAALLAHESAVMLPVLVAAIVVFERARGRVGSVRPCVAWLVAGSGVLIAHLSLLAWAYRVRAATYPESGYRFVGLGADLASAPLRYAAQLAAPPPWTEALALGSAALVLGGVALVMAAVWWWRGSGVERLGLTWLVLAAVPYLAFGVYGVADRYYYFPSVGLALAAAVALARAPRLALGAAGAYAVAASLMILQAATTWRGAGDVVRGTMYALASWSETVAGVPEGLLFVGVRFKAAERWPGSQVYVFSTGIVGATHLATRWSRLPVSYVFADEYPGLSARLARAPAHRGPMGLYLFAFEDERLVDRTAQLGSSLPELAMLRWRGGSRTPVDLDAYGVAAGLNNGAGVSGR